MAVEDPPTGRKVPPAPDAAEGEAPTVGRMAKGVQSGAGVQIRPAPIAPKATLPEDDFEAATEIANLSPVSTSAPDPDGGVRAGQVLAGKYRVERVLGVGGMGVVVSAHHLQLDERVALKFLLPEALKNTESVNRFLQEARAAVKIKGEHVARVSDVGQLENGSPYIVMEYLEGIDLSAWLKQRGPLPIEQAVDFVLQACEAIADAHALGIVHRDLKPANLFCVRRSDGQFSIKVLDFGISKVMTPGALGHNMTRTTALVGSPFYMSPEQMQLSKAVDARSDIWALGVILFELLTGRPPFQSEALTDLAIKVANEPTPPARALRAEVPPALEQVIGTCLAKDRNARYPSIAELAIALREFGSRQARVSVERVLGTLREAGISGASLPMSASQYPTAAVSGPNLGASAGAISGVTSGVISGVTSGITPAAPAPGLPETGASWGKTGARTKASRAPLVWLAAAAVVGGLAGVGVLVSRRASSPAPATTAAAAVSPPATTAAGATAPTAASPRATVTQGAATATGDPGLPVIPVDNLPAAKPAPMWPLPVHPGASASPSASAPPSATASSSHAPGILDKRE